jgi:effector-binding domain-containing protein
MKALKIIGGIVLGLIALYVVLCLAGPKEVNVVRTTEIEAPASVIYGNLEDFRKWGEWSTWEQQDPAMVSTYSGPEKGVGAVHTWTSETMGNGSQEITEADAPKFLRTKLQFGNWEGYSYSDWNLEQHDGCKTAVSWSLEGDRPTPFFFRGILLVMNFKGSIIKDYDQGLANLKALSEQQYQNLPVNYRGYEVQQIEFPGQTYAAIRQEMTMDALQPFFAASYGAIMKGMQTARLTSAGAPSALYYSWDEAGQRTDVAAGIPVNAVADIAGVEMIDVPGGKALAVDFYGDYENLGEAHYAFDDYMKDRCLKQTGPAIEAYITDPVAEPDPAKWHTRIIYFYE